MPIPTELVGSLPRPMKLQEAYEAYDQGDITWEQLKAQQDEAAKDSIERLEATGERFVTDGEQRESSFATYPITDTLAGPGWPTTSQATASSSRSSTTATTASCPG
jgi:methionine synthase II (cobalamin-independent)